MKLTFQALALRRSMFFFLTSTNFKLIPCLTLEAVMEVEHPETGPGH